MFFLITCRFINLAWQSIWQGDGSWCLSCFRCPSRLGGATCGYPKCLQHHFQVSHLSKALCNMKLIVSTFPLCSILLCLVGSPFLEPPFPFRRSISHPFFGVHTPKQSTCQTSFCTSPFLCIMMLCKGFSLLYFPFTYQWHSHIGQASIVHLAFDHFVSQLASMGLVVQPHKCSVWSPS